MVDELTTLDDAKCAEIGRRCTCYNLRRASRVITRLYEDFLRPSGLRVTQYSILIAAHLRGPITITKLADLTVTERTTLTRNLNVLQKKGLVLMEPGRDRRERRVTITEKGRETLLTAIPLWEKAQAYMENGLGPDEMRHFVQDISKVTALARKP